MCIRDRNGSLKLAAARLNLLTGRHKISGLPGRCTRGLVLPMRNVAKVNPFKSPRELKHESPNTDIISTGSIVLAERATHRVVVRAQFNPRETSLSGNFELSLIH